MRPRIAALGVVVFVLAALARGGAVQADLGSISGVVADSAGGVIPGVTVEAASPALIEKVRSTGTDGQGAFRLDNLPPGEYQVTASLPGFTPTAAVATVAGGEVTHLSFELRLGALSETITVTGQTPRVNVSSALRQLGGRFSRAPQDTIEIGPRAAGFNTEAYDHVDENPFKLVASDPLSTFSIDVDTASYANMRRFIRDGQLPEPGGVRIEELVNYFRLPYATPKGDDPFSITTELAPCPWNGRHRLALIGIQGRALPEREAAPRNLVFLIDVSGSMNDPKKLPLVQASMRLLVDALSERDRVAIVVYAGESGLVLPSTPGTQKAVIARAIAELQPGGSTNGADGIQLAYRIARERFIKGGVNRVILATDGDFNVGVTSQDALVRLIEQERETGVFLSVLGVGTGNLKDSTMEKLADKGNGNYAYLDSLQEARKVLVHELGGTLTTIAKDVKIQVEFNPLAVDGYRLIGYENRVLANQDFNDDRKDAGDIGAGHSVTALYEIVPRGERTPGTSKTALKYQREPETSGAARSSELMTVHVRFKAPDADQSRKISTTVRNQTRSMSDNLGFASAVAEFGMLLQGSDRSGQASYASVIDRARRFSGDDREGYRAEFIALVEKAAQLRAPERRRASR